MGIHDHIPSLQVGIVEYFNAVLYRSYWNPEIGQLFHHFEFCLCHGPCLDDLFNFSGVNAPRFRGIKSIISNQVSSSCQCEIIESRAKGDARKGFWQLHNTHEPAQHANRQFQRCFGISVKGSHTWRV